MSTEKLGKKKILRMDIVIQEDGPGVKKGDEFHIFQLKLYHGNV